MAVYFDLKELKSYMVKTKNGKYHFKKGQPLKVEIQEDIDRFRSDVVLVEVDKNGNPIVQQDSRTIESRGYRRFREANLRLPDEPEALLRKVYEETVKERETKGVDVAKLLEEAKKDALNKEDGEAKIEAPPQPVKVEEEKEAPKAAAEEVIKEVAPKKLPKAKKKPNECEKCGRSFKTKTELEKHLLDHEDEE